VDRFRCDARRFVAASAQKREFSFAYDQPRTSAYGFGADFFGKKLQELSKGNFSTNQYPGAAARHRSADAAEGADRRHRLRAGVDRQLVDHPAGIGRVLAALHLPRAGARGEGTDRCQGDRGDARDVRLQGEGAHTC
jgi:hypothetical protein